MNKSKVIELRAGITATLQEIESANGIVIQLLNGKYDDTSVTFQLKITETGGNANFDVGEAEFKKHCIWFGLKPEHYGQQFESQGKTFTVAGLKPQNTKYPIICNSRGTPYKLEADRVAKALGVQG